MSGIGWMVMVTLTTVLRMLLKIVKVGVRKRGKIGEKIF